MEIAHLLEKHVGSGHSEYICEQALCAIRKIKSIAIRNVLLVRLKLAPANCTKCDLVRAFINMVRFGNLD